MASDPARGPGAVLIAMAVICSVAIIVPIGGLAFLPHQAGISPGLFLRLTFSQPTALQIVLVLPTVLLLALSFVYLIAFFARTVWGPVALAVLAGTWAISASASTVLIPAIAIPGGLPLTTFIAMIPSVIPPLLFGHGFGAFMITGESPRRWFSARSRS